MEEQAIEGETFVTTDPLSSDSALNIRVSRLELTENLEAASADVALEPPDSGDFHESFVVPDGTGDVAVLLGDVTGHGSEAAAKAHTIRKAVVSHLKAGDSPLRTIEAANAVSQTPDDRYATLFVAKVNGKTGEVTYANAGHEQPIVTNDCGRSQTLETTGPPLGVVPAGIDAFEQKSAHLPNDGTMVITTDGVTEARIPHEPYPVFFESARLRSIVERLRRFSPLHIVQSIMKRVLRFTRSVLTDDIVIMAIRRRQVARAESHPKRR